MNPDEVQETPQQAIEKYTTDFTKLAVDGKNNIGFPGLCLLPGKVPDIPFCFCWM